MPKHNFGPKNAAEATVFAVEELRAEIQYAILASMKEEGLSQVALAERLGCSPAAVSQFLDDDANLTLESVAKLFLALGRQCKVTAVPMRDQFETVPSLSESGIRGRWLQTAVTDSDTPSSLDEEGLFAALRVTSINAPRANRWANDNVTRRAQFPRRHGLARKAFERAA